MKCIKSTEGVIVRVNDSQADIKVKTGVWSYVSKSEWKKDRGILPKSIKSEEIVTVKVKKTPKPPKQSKQDKNKKGR